MGMSEAGSGVNITWNEHNKVLRTQNDHRQRLVIIEGRMDRMEAHSNEQHGSVCTKLDGLSMELRGMSDQFIAERAAAAERERLQDKSLSMKWPLFFSLVSALAAFGMLVMGAITMVGGP